jgi:SAM-dependent methyltransferase
MATTAAPPGRTRLQWRHFLDRVVDPAIDRALGMETNRYVSVQDLGLDPDQAFAYGVAGWRSLQVILKRSELGPEDVFADLGCGKGRVLYLASRYPFKRVIGVDLSEEMAAQARRNLRRRPQVEVEVANAAEWPVPDDLTYVFFHNPFPNWVFQKAIEHTLESLARRPRRLRVIYRRPHRMHGYLLDWGFRLIRHSDSGPTNLYEAPHS